MKSSVSREAASGSSTTKNVLQARLDELRSEHYRGEAELATAQRKLAHITETLLRINGAIQVLEEVLSSFDESAGTNNGEPSCRESVDTLAPAQRYG
jgi:hypothetical protein